MGTESWGTGATSGCWRRDGPRAAAEPRVRAALPAPAAGRQGVLHPRSLSGGRGDHRRRHRARRRRIRRARPALRRARAAARRGDRRRASRVRRGGGSALGPLDPRRRRAAPAAPPGGGVDLGRRLVPAGHAPRRPAGRRMVAAGPARRRDGGRIDESAHGRHRRARRAIVLGALSGPVYVAIGAGRRPCYSGPPRDRPLLRKFSEMGVNQIQVAFVSRSVDELCDQIVASPPTSHHS